MTHAEMILYAVKNFHNQGISVFSREDIRSSLGINSEDWTASFSPVFQGMRNDQPGGAPPVKERFRNVFKRIRRGKYMLTDYGATAVEETLSQQTTLLPPPLPKAGMFEFLGDPNPKPPHAAQLPHLQKAQIQSEKVQLILRNAETYHQAYYQSKVFGNPCLYFHIQALKTRQDPTSAKHLEYVYAVLIAWGMNRLGKGGSKMKDFDTFSKCIQQLEDYILKAQSFDCFSMDEEKWSILEKIFKGIQVMESNSSLVGNSKVMHHMLPNLIPPIDRTYTLSFLYGNTTIRNDLNSEWQLMKSIIENFFIPVASDNNFQLLANNWIGKSDEYPWDTSLLKVIDNIIVGQKK